MGITRRRHDLKAVYSPEANLSHRAHRARDDSPQKSRAATLFGQPIIKNAAPAQKRYDDTLRSLSRLSRRSDQAAELTAE